jgi:hypothetical protein
MKKTSTVRRAISASGSVSPRSAPISQAAGYPFLVESMYIPLGGPNIAMARSTVLRERKEKKRKKTELRITVFNPNQMERQLLGLNPG